MNEKLIEALKQAIEIHNEVFGTSSNVVASPVWRSEIIAIAELLRIQPLTVMNYSEMDSVNIVNAAVSKKKGGKDGV